MINNVTDSAISGPIKNIHLSCICNSTIYGDTTTIHYSRDYNMPYSTKYPNIDQAVLDFISQSGSSKTYQQIYNFLINKYDPPKDTLVWKGKYPPSFQQSMTKVFRILKDNNLIGITKNDKYMESVVFLPQRDLFESLFENTIYDDIESPLNNSESETHQPYMSPLATAHAEHMRQIKEQLKEYISSLNRAENWMKFEYLLGELFRKMGFTVEPTPPQNDNGVDAWLHYTLPTGEPRLCALQAKMWNPNSTRYTIDRPQIQGFVGAMVGRNCNTGFFISTAPFTEGAKEYVEDFNIKSNGGISLWDFDRLITELIKNELGVVAKLPYVEYAVVPNFFDTLGEK